MSSLYFTVLLFLFTQTEKCFHTYQLDLKLLLPNTVNIYEHLVYITFVSSFLPKFT